MLTDAEAYDTIGTMMKTETKSHSSSGLGHQAPQPGNGGSNPPWDTNRNVFIGRKLRLFKIEVEGKPVYCDDKRVAKRLKKDYGAEVVMRGPDHRLGESYNIASQTPSSKRLVR